jgi:anti-sigma factor ChrR (cupin superfamily)
MARVARAPREQGVLLQQSGLLISRSQEMDWQSFAPGIVFKPLFTDTDRQYATCLVRMDAGARYPSHRHVDLEELFLLSGDLHVGPEVMQAGDYCRAVSDSVHSETFSESGCLFLLLASQRNELLA